MKKRKLLIASVLSICSIFGLVGCTTNTTNPGGNNIQEQPNTNENGLQVKISGPTLVNVGETITLSATLENDTNRLGVTWSSADESIATVSGGVVTGVGAGTVEITATSNEDEEVYDSIIINVMEVEDINLNIEASNIAPTIGETVTIKVNLDTTTTPKIYWKAQNDLGSLIATNDPSTIQYNPRMLGTETIEADIYVGNYSYREEIVLTVSNNDYTSFEQIATKEAFLDFFNAQATSRLTGNYCLTADIDLGGEVLDCSIFKANCGIAGIFDGRGHSIKNYVLENYTQSVVDGVPQVDENGEPKMTRGQVGLFNGVAATGAIRNTHFVGTIGYEGTAWGSAGVTTGCDGIIDNCLVEMSHTWDTSSEIDQNGYFPFCAAVSGTFNGQMNNVVVNVLNEGEAAYGFASMYADVAYPTGGQNYTTKQTFKIDNFYTTSTIVGGQRWDWGEMVHDMTGYKTGIDFSSSKASDFSTLPSTIWNVQDGAMPTLKTF